MKTDNLTKADAKTVLDTRPFDDFLGLENTDFKDVRLIAFCGISGSGKSRALRFLENQHPDFQNRRTVWIDPGTRSGGFAGVHRQLVIMDEIRNKSQLASLRTLLRLGNTVAVASHVHPWQFWPLRLFWRTKVFKTDQSRDKIARFLDQSDVSFSRDAIEQYCQVFGANYLDACHIMERYPGQSFDAALQRFFKFCGMQPEPDLAQDNA